MSAQQMVSPCQCLSREAERAKAFLRDDLVNKQETESASDIPVDASCYIADDRIKKSDFAAV